MELELFFQFNPPLVFSPFRFGPHSSDFIFLFLIVLLIKLSFQLHPSIFHIILLIELSFQLHPSIFHIILLIELFFQLHPAIF
jgi:hypothetical protein